MRNFSDIIVEKLKLFSHNFVEAPSVRELYTDKALYDLIENSLNVQRKSSFDCSFFDFLF